MTTEMEVATKYQSHLPALLAAVAASEGPVLELGVGYFSTPQLHALCGTMYRRLVSFESDKEWLAEFSNRLSNHLHDFVMECPLGMGEQWGVVFVDHSPGGQNRADAFLKAGSESQFVVVHDYHLENEDAIKPLLNGFMYHVTRSYDPPTLIASRHHAIPPSILCL